MQALLQRTKPKGRYAKIIFEVGTTKNTFYLPAHNAVDLSKSKVLQIGAPLPPQTVDIASDPWAGNKFAPRRAPATSRGRRVRKASAGALAAAPTADQAQYVKSLKEAQGGAYRSAEYERLADISRQALKQRRDAFSIVYWTDAKGHCWYPKWQFDVNHQVRPEVRQILGLLATHDTLRVLTAFLVPAVGDAGESPLHLIQTGRGTEAVDFVRSLVDER